MCRDHVCRRWPTRPGVIELYLVLVSVRVDLDAHAVSVVFEVLAFVGVTGDPEELARAVLEVVRPVAFVPVASVPGVLALSAALVVFDVAFVDSVGVLDAVPAVEEAAFARALVVLFGRLVGVWTELSALSPVFSREDRLRGLEVRLFVGHLVRNHSSGFGLLVHLVFCEEARVDRSEHVLVRPLRLVPGLFELCNV